VAGNFLGTDPTGRQARPNGWRGVLVYNSATGCTIGGHTPADRNVVSGNSQGVVVASNSNTVVGNYIGTDASGTAALGNSAGMEVTSASFNVIGGTSPEARNVISGNSSAAVGIDNGAQGNLVQGNFIGTDASGAHALPNSSPGVWISDGFSGPSDGNTIGGLAPGAGNVIAFNAGPGVTVSGYGAVPSTGNAILGNLIHDNAGLAIDLGYDGVTPNDPGDQDGGPNALQNFPSVGSAARVGSRLRVFGTLDSTPGASFTVQVFADRACDANGYGQAERLLATVGVETDSVGHAQFTTTVGPLAAVGEKVTATATDAAGNTSELSPCRTVGRGVFRRFIHFVR
jgi:hypothetical protein